MGEVDDAFDALVDAQDKHESETAIWVKSDVGPTGSYILSVEVGPDRSFALSPAAAAEYAQTVLTAVARATHDAAVLAQLGAMANFDSGAQAVVDLRRDRPPLNDATTAPLRFVPIILSQTAKPAIDVYWDADAPTGPSASRVPLREQHQPVRPSQPRGDHVTQWPPDSALEHAVYVLLGAATVDLDDAYVRYLHGVVGVDRPKAMAAVNDLIHWREDT